MSRPIRRLGVDVRRAGAFVGAGALVALLVVAPAAGAVEYVYDELDRLTEVVYDNGSRITYTYDAAGNRLSRTVGVDPDGDGILFSGGANSCTGGSTTDCEDNCPRVENADQADADGDGVGDLCDVECDDGLDNDNDGRIDFDPITFANPGDQTTPPSGAGDPGCGDVSWSESPQCQDGIDNDGDGKMDYDAGYSANGSPASGGPDPECVGRPWWNSEAPWLDYCGLGAELALLMPPLIWLYRRRVRAPSRSPIASCPRATGRLNETGGSAR